MCYNITELTESMLPALLELEQACFSSPWSRNMFLGELKNPNAYYKVIVKDMLPIAYMGMWVVADEGQITNIAVHPDVRKKGLASWLLEEFIGFAKQKELAFLTLEVRRSNEAAKSLYKKFGFVEVGMRPNYYEQKEDALLFTLFLKEEA